MSADPAGVELIEAAPVAGFDELEPALLDAFTRARDAVLAGRAVVVVLADRDLLGQGSPAAAALANALVGLVRTLSVEGVRDGWSVNALALPEEIADERRSIWIERLGSGDGATGAVLRLGDQHLGRVPV